MVKLDKIYTRGGDKGQTSLGNGIRVHKHNFRVVSYGEIDEANSIIGICIIYSSDELKNTLRIIQNDLFDIGADLCMPEDSKNKTLKVKKNQINFLEKQIDMMNKNLDDLKSFILPGGSKSAAYLHHARCVVRRAERSISNLTDIENVNETILKYVNRLSDFLFVASRYENRDLGDTLWEPAKYQKGI